MELTIDQISKTYRRTQALTHVSIQFGHGIHALLGPNGAGKSTLMKIIMGIVKPTEGSVRWNGADVSEGCSDFLSQVGYLPQNMAYYPNYTGREFMEYMAVLKGLRKKEIREETGHLLDLVNLGNDKDRKIGAYSGGMKQRLGIAQCLINDPALIIFDEPTAGLDPRERIRFRNILSKLSRDKIIILSTHIVPDVDMIANHVLILKEGELLTEGTSGDLQQILQGKIWNVTVGNDTSWMTKDMYLFNVSAEGQSYTYRMYSPEKPCQWAEPAQTTLEDVYLYYFREDNTDAFAM